MLAIALPTDETPSPDEQPGYGGVAKAAVACINSINDRLSPLVQTIRLAPLALATMDRDMNYLCYSQRFFDDFRLGLNYGFFDNLKGVNHYDAFPNIQKLRPDWVEVHQRVLAEGVTVKSDGLDYYKERNGDVLYMQWTVAPWFDRGGAVGGLTIHCGPIQRVGADELLCPTCHTVIAGDSRHGDHGEHAARPDNGDFQSRP